jgi:hypothetical protein
MQGDFPEFCYRQSAKMIEYAEGCIDPVLKEQLLTMSANWLKMTAVPREASKQSILESTD